MKKITNALLVITLFFFSCNKDEKVDFKPVEAGINGFVQKGPFISGSSITIQELDDNFTPTGKTYNTVTEDDFGSFKLKSIINSPYIEVIAQGFYYNEVSGKLSQSTLTLRALLKTSSAMIANVNVLTTLSERRIMYLVENDGLPFNVAQKQAEAEILNIFGISETDILDFNEMDMSKEGESHAILLAISSILQGFNSVAELSELISKIITDIKEDGTLDNNLSYLKMNALILNLHSIRSNLESRYKNLGLNVAIPDFESYAKRLVPLAVLYTTPHLNEKNVPTDVSIMIQFNKPIDMNSVTANSIHVTNEDNALPGTFSYDNETYTVAFIPDALLLPSTNYAVTINSNLKGSDGLPLLVEYSTGFVTESFDIICDLSNYYPFSGDFTDQSGNNRSALPIGVIFTQDRYSVADHALLFQGDKNYVDIPRFIDPVNSEWTFSVWFKLDQLPSSFGTYADAFLLTRQKDDGECDIYLYVDDADNMIKSGIVYSHKKLSSGVALTAGQWVNATMTYSSNSISIYVNGELKVTSNDRFTFRIPVSEPYRIASMFNGVWDDAPYEGRIHGAIDDVRLYERCLNSNEVKHLFEEENGGRLKSTKLLNVVSDVSLKKTKGGTWH